MELAMSRLLYVSGVACILVGLLLFVSGTKGQSGFNPMGAYIAIAGVSVIISGYVVGILEDIRDAVTDHDETAP